MSKHGVKPPNYCGMVYAEDLNRDIACFHRRGESCQDCMERIRKAHIKGPLPEEGEKSDSK